jgi:MFS family permease
MTSSSETSAAGRTETPVRRTEDAKVAPYAWVVLAVGFIASVAGPLGMFKVSTVLPTLIRQFHLSLSVAGLMVSVFAVTGFILALPASSIFQKLGLKWTCVVSTAVMIVGSLMGTFATTGGVLLVSRFVEGAGMGLIAVAVPSAIAAWFPGRRRGIAMGIWNNWMTVGSILAFSAVPAVVARGTYKNAWWFSTTYSAVALVLCLFFMRMPRPREVPALLIERVDAPSGSSEKVTLRAALNGRNIWLAMIVALCFGAAINVVPTYYPTFVTGAGVMTAGAVAVVITVENVLGMAGGLTAGFLFDRVRNRKLMFTWPLVGFAILFLLLFGLRSLVAIYVWMLVYAFVTSLVPTCLFATAPEIMKSPAYAGYAMGMINMGQDVGLFLGPPLVGAIAAHSSWPIAGASLAPILVFGTVIGLLVKLPRRPKAATAPAM